MEVSYSRIYGLKVVKLVIMSGKQGLCPMAVFVNVFYDSPGNRHSVIGRGTPSDFIQKHKGTLGKIVQNHGGFKHLHHKSGFSAGNVVRRAHAGENLVTISDFGLIRRHETAYLCKQDNQGGLPQKSRLTGHVRTCKNYNLLRISI